MNITCDEWLLMEPEDRWQSVNADGILQTFRTMYIGNKLMCTDCYGMSQATCSSSDVTCEQGLHDLASSGGISRWDQALGVFAQSQSDLNCGIEDSSQCSQAPDCDSDHGPAGLALLKSMTAMHNSLSNVYMAIDRAHMFATNQMGVLSAVFAPVPNMKNTAIFMEIMFAIAGVMAGFIPGLGAAFAGLLVGVGAAFVMNNLIFDHPGAPDVQTVLAKVVSNVQGAYSQVANSLFTNGSYTYSIGDGNDEKDQKSISWSTLMANGSLLQQEANTTDALEPVYERILYQQLAVYTWKTLEAGDEGHIPFIAFENQPCDQINATHKSPLDHVIKGVSKTNTNITYNGACYYLLDGTTKKDLLGRHTCIGKKLNGGTNKDLTEYSEEFRDFSLADFIIPSVKGWQAHDQQNDSQNATEKGAMFTDPQDSGAVSLPICDYLGKPDSPGVNCPRFGKTKGKSCRIHDLSTGINQPGEFVEGRCGVHVEQWQKHHGDENLAGDYQISVEILDNDRRHIGAATKQSAAGTLDIVDSVLPYDLHVATGTVDEDPIRFWYSDQYWNSSDVSLSHQCSVGDYSGGSRTLDCSFQCPEPDETEDPPVSATIINPFPNTPITAIDGKTTYSNIYETATPILADNTAAPTSTYASG